MDLEAHRRETADAVNAYTPKVKGRIDDLALPIADLLRQLPGVATVEVLVAPAKRTHRIIHLADWHFVPKDLYALELGFLSDEELEARYRKFLDEVELVQIEQEGVLRCLIRHHGLRRVLYEGLTPEETRLSREKVKELRTAGPAIREQVRAVRSLLKKLRDAKQGTRYEEGVAAEQTAFGLLEEHRVDVLKFGAPGRFDEGELEVAALDEAGLLEKAKPVTPEGTVKVDAAAVRARNDAQVKVALKNGPCAVIVLGGGHDLSPSVRRLTGTTEYIRVVTKRYKGFAGR
jgi:hypothetical protein